VIDYKVLRYGKTVAKGKQGIDAAWLMGLDPKSFPMLGHLIPYGDTMFNSLQVRTLLAELGNLSAGHPLISRIGDDLRALCQLVLAEPHGQLWFFGD
jgi:hypothetical protein